MKFKDYNLFGDYIFFLNLKFPYKLHKILKYSGLRRDIKYSRGVLNVYR